MKETILLLILITSSILVAGNTGNGSGYDEIKAMQKIALNGMNAGEHFGSSVASAGDINGDGFDDMIIGAPKYNSQAGRVFVFYGGLVPNNSYDLVINGTGTNLTGYSVSSMGDFNGDGYDDFMYSTPGYSTNSGSVFGHLGSENPDIGTTVNFKKLVSGEQFGYSISCAGDLNGDGYSDVIIGAPEADNGRAYIYFGGSTINTSVDVTLTGTGSGDYFGSSVSSAGDVNGDGYADVIVGSYRNTSRAFIFFGGSTMNNVADIILYGPSTADFFGCSVSGAGDMNCDGYSDVIVGAYGDDTGGTDAGIAYIFFGGAAMDTDADVSITGYNVADMLGYSVSSCGDINGDGYDDVITGAYGNNAGKAYVLFGGRVMNNIPDAIMAGQETGDFFGFSVAKAGDVNGDGYSDVLIGAYKNDINAADCGRAYLYTNSLTGYDIEDEIFLGSEVSELFGASVKCAGDVNGDGFDDIMIGTYDLSNSGNTYIYFGGEELDSTPDVILASAEINDLFGTIVSPAGDVNGDGYDDVVVGASNHGNSDGRVYIFFGGSNMDAIADVTLSDTSSSRFGYSVSGAGDVNGDGYDDVIVGTSTSSDYSGWAYIYYGAGGSTMDDDYDVRLRAGWIADYFGRSVSGGGDINGDGYDDVIVGAPGYNVERGAALIFFGGANMDEHSDVWITGKAGDKLGSIVNIAGDLNGDGFDDVAVFVEEIDSTYIYYGGLKTNTDVDIQIAAWGAISGAGDVNRDGYDDFISYKYIYFGGLSMDSNVDIELSSNEIEDGFGSAVSSAGDINDDGYDDVIVGAPTDSEVASWAGKAYLFLSTAPSSIPRIMSVEDIPYDEGGLVDVNFIRSALDSREVNTISEYQIHRSNPPGTSGFSWSLAGTVSPSQDARYTYVASTPNDSMTNNSGTYFYRVTAVNSTGEIWKSNIVSGHSVDNLAPDAPKGAAANRSGYDVVLTWDENTESDLKQYLIYRNSTTPLPEDAVPIASTTDLTYTDTSPLEEMVYYFIKAEDVHANKSTPAETNLDVYLGANVKVFLQGCYSGSSMTTTLNSAGYIPLSQPYNTTPWNYAGTESVASIPTGVVDWVLVELRSDLTTVAGTRAGFLKSDGTITDTDGTSKLNFSGLNSGDYYVVIRHRNHLAIMTANKVTLTNNSSQYNFSSAQTQAYGTNPMIDLGSGVYGSIAGDANASGDFSSIDASRIKLAIRNGYTGYRDADINLSGDMSSVDYSRAKLGIRNGYSTKVPTSSKNKGINSNKD